MVNGNDAVKAVQEGKETEIDVDGEMSSFGEVGEKQNFN